MATRKVEKEEDRYQVLRLDHQLCFPLYAAANLVQRLYRPLLEPLGLTYSQYLVMLVLWERGAVHVGEITHCLHLDIGTMTPLLKRMEQARLITRRRDPQDDRRVIVDLTSRGRALRGKAAEIPHVLARNIDIRMDKALQLRQLTTSLVARMAELVA
jgi:DNA-binding MarR family transcriptional regulator